MQLLHEEGLRKDLCYLSGHSMHKNLNYVFDKPE